MPLVGNAFVREPFLTGASSHTKEAQFHNQKGSHTFNISISYGGSLLDHLAEYKIYLSTASSFCFSFNSSYDHEFHPITIIWYVPTGLRAPSCGSPPCSLPYKMGLLHHELK